MRKLLKRMGWIGYRGRIDWKEIRVDVIVLVVAYLVWRALWN